MWLSNIRNNKMLWASLVAGFWGGIAGVLPDIDHPLAYLLFQGARWRFLHQPILIISCIVLGGIIAYGCGLYCSLVLMRKRK